MAKDPGNVLDYRSYQNVRGQTPIKEAECATLFFDVVEFSKDKANEEMIDVVKTMQDRMYKLLEPDYYWGEKSKHSRKNNFALIPTGDGYGLTLNNLEKDEKILDIASSMHEAFTRADRFRFRMGIARGQNLFTLDLNGQVNVFGYGIVFATRVCNAAKAGQILVDSHFAISLLQRSRNIPLKQIEEDFETKHGEKFTCHNYSGPNFGIEV